ncbi:MAG: HDOD domain-containing protein [Verrucomicrobiota bacterium]
MITDKYAAQFANLTNSIDVVVRLMFMLKDRDIENSDIANVVATDKVLSNTLLKKLEKISNKESGYTPPELDPSEKEPVLSNQEIFENLEMAIMRLGHGEILKQVSGISFGKILGGECKGYGIAKNELWVHSVTVALISQELAKLINTIELAQDENAVKIDTTIAFVSGLLHDLGKTALSGDLAAKSSTFRTKIDSRSNSWIEVEKHICNIDHAAYGAQLTKKWKLSDEISTAIAGHHTPPANERLTAIVHLADCGSRILGSAPGIGGFAFRSDPRALQTVNLTMDNIEQVLMHVAANQDTIANYCATS